ncbi:MAG: hypothetical protein HYV04_06040, partial [Deltaproteobacteria bacterium]|nr:hypothetical protein [Deltaproteobacteria bacterium]
IEMVARIRAFELHLLKLFGQGQLSGTTHTCVGQELCAAVLSPLLDPQRDYVFSNHRCHGHFMAFGGSMPDLLSEIMGREGGVCGGRGGSQHLCSGNFFSNGLQGGNLPIATGVALARRLTDGERTVPGGIVVCFIGDGTLGEGIVYETMNLASLWSLPLLVVVEHNGYAQSTDTRTTTSGDVAQRFAAFGIATDRRSPECLEVLCEHLRQVVAGVRGTDGRPVRPFVQILDTFRLAAHSKGDDHRPPEVIQAAWRGDWFNRLLEKGDAAATEAWRRAEVEVDEVEKEVTSRPMMAMERIEAYAPIEVPLFGSSVELVAGSGVDLTLRINECLNRGLGELMERRDDVILLGEDLADPYGGAFKVTKGLSARFPHRVLNTPISEAAITGVSTGLALAGMRPVVEIMFGDFVTLAMDQLINHASKLFFMSNERVKVPLVLRLVSGGYRGYGATHSQSLEARLCGVPGLKVVALSRRHDPVRLLAATIEHAQASDWVRLRPLSRRNQRQLPGASLHVRNRQIARDGGDVWRSDRCG